MHRLSKQKVFLVFILLSLYGLLGYGVERHEHVILFSIYFLLFAGYVWIYQSVNEETFKFWVYASLAFRVIFLFSIPALSDDFYRFIWDGRLLSHGVHPFAELPSYYLNLDTPVPGINQWLYDHLNSQSYFTVYPPLSQYIFWIATFAFPDSILGSVVVMRVFILLAEFGSLMLLWKLLPRYGMSQRNVLIYALNPLVIIELTGNLHFEALIIFFVILTLFLLWQNRIVLAGISIGSAIATKLIPLIFLPHFLLRLRFRKSILFYLVVLIACCVLSMPLLNLEIIDGFQSSLGLYFRKFEFNASIYYLVREYGFWAKGYNTIESVGWKLAVISTICILIVSLWPSKYSIKNIFGKDQSESFPPDSPTVMMWVLLTYLLFTTTVHPWYITTLLMLSVFTRFKFVMVWTALIFLTYMGYSEATFYENLYWVILEYSVVIGYLTYELIWKRKVAV